MQRFSKRVTKVPKMNGLKDHGKEIDLILEQSRSVRARINSRQAEVFEQFEVEDSKLSRLLSLYPATYADYIKERERQQNKKQRRMAALENVSVAVTEIEGPAKEVCHALNFHLARQGEGRHHHRTGNKLDPVATDILGELALFLQQQGEGQFCGLSLGVGSPPKADTVPNLGAGFFINSIGSTPISQPPEIEQLKPVVKRSGSDSEVTARALFASSSAPGLEGIQPMDSLISSKEAVSKNKLMKSVSSRQFTQATISHMLRVAGDTYLDRTVNPDEEGGAAAAMKRKKKMKKRTKPAQSAVELERLTKQHARDDLFAILDSARMQEESLEQELYAAGGDGNGSIDTAARLEMFERLEQMQNYYSKQILGLISDYQPKLPTADIQKRNDAIDLGLPDPLAVLSQIDQSFQAMEELETQEEEEKKAAEWDEGAHEETQRHMQGVGNRVQSSDSVSGRKLPKKKKAARPLLPMAEIGKNLINDILADPAQLMNPQDLPVVRHADSGGHTMDHGLRDAVRDHTTFIDPSFPSMEFYRRKHMDDEGYLMPGFKPKHYGPGQSDGGYWVSSRAEVRKLKSKKNKKPPKNNKRPPKEKDELNALPPSNVLPPSIEVRNTDSAPSDQDGNNQRYEAAFDSDTDGQNASSPLQHAQGMFSPIQAPASSAESFNKADTNKSERSSMLSARKIEPTSLQTGPGESKAEKIDVPELIVHSGTSLAKGEQFSSKSKHVAPVLPGPLGWVANLPVEAQVEIYDLLAEPHSAGRLPPPPYIVVNFCEQMGLSNSQAEEVMDALYDNRMLPFVPQRSHIPSSEELEKKRRDEAMQRALEEQTKKLLDDALSRVSEQSEEMPPSPGPNMYTAVYSNLRFSAKSPLHPSSGGFQQDFPL